MTSINFADLVRVNAGFKPSVQLPADFEHDPTNRQLIETYIPTSQSITLFAEIARSLMPNNTERARTFVGTYGTGKSDLLLMLCNYFARQVDDPIMQPFYERLKAIDPAQYNMIYQPRANRKPFLVVVMQADPETRFPGFVLHGLHRALEAQGLAHLMDRTRYAAARQQIEAWQRTSHPILQRFIEELRKGEGRELASLVAELDSPQADHALPFFQRAFHAATGTEFNMYGFSQPDQTYVQVARALKERGSHSGILVVCDEFTEFLRRFEQAIDQQAREVDAETLAVQNLAESSERSGEAQLHFVVASLTGFAGASAESSSAQASKAIERVGGRFKSYSLQIQGSEELIRGAIVRLPAAASVKLLPDPQRDELLTIAERLWRPQNKSREWIRTTIIDGAFPLHPLTTFALPLINQQVAQSQRTMFLFLNDAQGLKGFLQRETLESGYANWHNLLTLDLLFDYFEESIEVRRSELADAYRRAVQVLHNVTFDTTLARRILKIVTLCEVISVPPLSPTRAFLRHALNLPPSAEGTLEAALDLLEQVEALVPPHDADQTANGIYSLPITGRVNVVKLQQQIKLQAQQLSGVSTSVARLQSKYPAEAIKADRYNRERGTDRQLTAFYVGNVDLNGAKLKADQSQARDALLWYVIASSETERSEAQSRARELTQTNPRLVVAVPIEPSQILDKLRTYDALEQVRRDATDETARKYLDDTGRVGKGIVSDLQVALAKLKDEQWEWFVNGASQPNITSRAAAQELASKVMSDTFAGTPAHGLQQHFKADSITPSMKKAVGEILKGEIRLGKTGASPENVILKTGAVNLDLLKLDKPEGAFEVYKLVEPSRNANSTRIWRLFQEYLTGGRPWSKLIATLRQPPYGLYDSVLLVFTAAFFTRNADAIEIAGGARQEAVDVAALERMLKEPEKYTVRLQPLTELESQWLRGIVTTGLKRQSDPSGSRGTTLRARVAEQVKEWIKRQRLPLFAEKLTADNLHEFLPDSPPATLNVVALLLQAGRNDFDLQGALLRDIPALLQAPTNHAAWTTETVNDLLAAYADACRTIERLPAVLEEVASARLAKVFGGEQDPPDARWFRIYQWRMNRKIVQPTNLPSSARTLFRLTSDPSGAIKPAFLEEFAGTIVGVNTSYQQWPSLETLNRVEQELQRAKNEIDDRWKELASKEEVWLDGLASAALGRPVAGTTAESAAQALAEWAKSSSWPASAATISAAEFQKLQPDFPAQDCADVTRILRRASYGAQEWQGEIADALAKEFGVVGWRTQEVKDAVTRFTHALRRAATFDTLLRQHTIHRLTRLFTNEQGSDGALPTSSFESVLEQWKAAHPIPDDNDLSNAARILLQQLNNNAVIETLLLMTLPRALPEIGQTYQQWPTYESLDQYVAVVDRAVREIHEYVPLTRAEYDWLTSVVTRGMRQPLDQAPHEQRRLARVVADQLGAWIGERRLPAFSAALTPEELRELFPQVESASSDALLLLLRVNQATGIDAVRFLMTILPQALGINQRSVDWSESDVTNLLDRFAAVCRLLLELNGVLTRRLYDAIGSVFDIHINGQGPASLVAHMRTWREAHILLSNEQLSPDAAVVFHALQTPADEPDTLLLTKLPSQLSPVRTPYQKWSAWSQRQVYVQALQNAAGEIQQLGKVGEATPRVRSLWDSFEQQINELTIDERRWLIKAFNDEFRP